MHGKYFWKSLEFARKPGLQENKGKTKSFESMKMRDKSSLKIK